MYPTPSNRNAAAMRSKDQLTTFKPKSSLAPAKWSFFNKQIGQLETLPLVRMGIENQPTSRTKAFDFGDVMHTKATALV